jgi:hypothetical protein
VLHATSAQSNNTCINICQVLFRSPVDAAAAAAATADYIGLTCGTVLPAIPDFNWGHACSGDVDDDGFCIVTVQVRECES